MVGPVARLEVERGVAALRLDIGGRGRACEGAEVRVRVVCGRAGREDEAGSEGATAGYKMRERCCQPSHLDACHSM